MQSPHPHEDDRRHIAQEKEADQNIVTLFSGDYYVSGSPDDMLVTILGSCIAACMCDPVAGVGGMNHFLLPGDESTRCSEDDATRYGVFAMEKLINGILSAGGRKDRLEIKLFGGGNVINNSMRIGTRNAEFAREFLLQEGLSVHSEDLEGDLPRRIHYFPTTGKVMMRKLRRKDDFKVVDKEADYRKKISLQPLVGAAELF